MTRARRGSGGFSLAEILVVLAILGLAVAVSVPLVLHQISKVRVHAAELQFSSDLKVARMIAVSTRRQVTFKVNIPAHTYEVPARQGSRTVELPEGIEIESAPSEIVFRPDGSVFGGAEIRLVARTSEVTERWTLTIGALGIVRTSYDRTAGAP